MAQAETRISGVEGELLDNVLAYLSIDNLSCAAGEAVIAQSIGVAADEAAEALQAYGYYEPVVTAGLTAGEDCWLADIRIEPGEPVRLRDVALTLEGPAASEPDFRMLRDSSTLLPGSVLRHADYDSLKRGLSNLARNRGYAEADFSEARIDVYPEEHVADVVLSFSSGPRYSVGTVTVNQDALDPEFVDAFFDLMPGIPYDNRLLTEAFLDLNNSSYFSTVDVSSLPADPESRTIPIEIDLIPAAHRLVSYGVGFSTDTGPRFRFGRAVRRFNRQGHQLNLDGQLSPVVSEFTTIYRMPLSDPRIDWLNFSVGAKRERTDTSNARSIEAGIRRVVDRTRGWSRTQFVSYIVEDFEVGTQSGRPSLLIPGVDWTRIRGDDALRPSNGSRLNFEVRAADEQFLSDTGFVQSIVSVKWIHSLTPKTRVLLRGRVGYMAEDDFAQLPPSVRFFAGGDTSVRGYDFRSLGPVDENGAVIGGTRLFESSAEIERDIKPKWSLALFVDHGNAFDGSDFDGRTGAGIGTRWRSPLGPVRVDIAWPIDDVKTGARLHVSLGPDL